MDILNSIRKEIREMEHYVEGKMPKKSKTDKKIKLSSNENRLGSSSKALKAIEEELKKGLNIYPDSGMAELRKAVSGFWERQGITVNTDELLFGDSSGEVLHMLLAAFIRDGDAVIIPEHSFSLYRLQSLPKGAVMHEVKRKAFRADASGMAETAQKVKNARVLILGNPDNPTSTFLSLDEVDSMLGKIPGNIAVILDEAYIHFTGINNTAMSLRKKYPNLILTYTYSKIYGLAGLRVGYAVMHKELSEQIEKIRLPFNLGALQQAGAIAASGDDEFVNISVRIIGEGKKYLDAEFSKLGIWHLKPYANFFFADFGKKSSEIIGHLEENGISIRPLKSFGFDENFVRISVGTPEDNEYLVEKLREVIL